VSKSTETRQQGGGRKWWLLAAPWAALVLLVAAMGGLLWIGGPSGLWTILSTGRVSAAASGPLDLTVIHTNDTWGFVFGCG